MLTVGRLGQRGRQSVLVTYAGRGCECPSCQARRAGARYAGVVRSPVVLIARCAQRDRVLGVIPSSARCAGVIACRRGADMRAASERHSPARPTRRSSRPLRARDRSLFGTLVVVRLRRLNGNPFGVRGNVVGIPFWSDQALTLPKRPLCQLRRAGARGAECGTSARCAGGSLCRRGTNARGADCPLWEA